MNQETTSRKRQLLAVLFALMTLISLIPIQVFAEEEAEGNSEFNFHVKPVLPQSQLEGGANAYFDLNLGAGQSDNLGLELNNHTDKPIEIEISAHTAFTNVNGVVEYGKDDEDPDPTLPGSLKELIQAPGTVTLEANETRIVDLPITMPEEEFTGVLAGGIKLKEVKNDNEEEEEDTGLAIKNDFAFVIGVVASNNRSATDPGLELLDVFADQLNYRNVFSATIQNYTSTFVNRLEVEATIREEGSSEVLYETTQEGMQMAPNSHFNFPIPLEGARFRSGTYVLNMTARSGDEEWSWEKTFEVTADEARRLNREDVTIDNSINWWMIAAISALVLLIVVVGYFVYRNKKSETKK
ncbi:DUF916 and DUF3324 domain-containing protein [Enterococcus sp. AZ109]|uniref:DUF916 and DUF3324 domain-containing protein n=1 Tax=Enterococcus sp. AZ109 TaxID=2774634 RepID=UPI003F25CAD9